MEIEMPNEPTRMPVGRVAQAGLIALVVVLVMIVIFWRKSDQAETPSTDLPQASASSKEPERPLFKVTTTPKIGSGSQARPARRTPVMSSADRKQIVTTQPPATPTAAQPGHQTKPTSTRRLIAKPATPAAKSPVSRSASASAPKREPLQHVVSDEDTLYRIAKRYYGRGSAWRLIAKANKLADPNKVPLGTRLIIPAARTARGASRPAPAARDRLKPAGSAWHVVASGENYIKIAKRYWGTSNGWRKIMKVNGFAEDKLPVGKKILIPAR